MSFGGDGPSDAPAASKASPKAKPPTGMQLAKGTKSKPIAVVRHTPFATPGVSF